MPSPPKSIYEQDLSRPRPRPRTTQRPKQGRQFLGSNNIHAQEQKICPNNKSSSKEERICICIRKYLKANFRGSLHLHIKNTFLSTGINMA
jgi:hypothetical protein